MTEEIEGWSQLLSWAGGPPRFHDAEVEEIRLTAPAHRCVLAVHAWRTRDEVDARGFFIQEAHVTVRFVLDDVVELRLDDWTAQNVLFGLTVERTAHGHAIDLDACHGVGGRIEAKSLRIELEPRPDPRDRAGLDV